MFVDKLSGMHNHITEWPPFESPTTVIDPKLFLQTRQTTPGAIVIKGPKQKFIQFLIWLNILFVSVKSTRNLLQGFKKTRQLKQLRDQYRNNFVLTKYRKIGKRYYHSYNAPGWPSIAFDRYVFHQVNKMPASRPVSIHTLIFAITKKCGFQCEHCCEWENLNKPEKLEKEDLLRIIQHFSALGISQVQLSGGEPLNRFNDILFLLDNMPAGIDCWIYTTGYQLTPEKAMRLKQHGLTGVTISIDDHDASRHDRFRGKEGSFKRAMDACCYAVNAGLAVTFSLCAVKSFISRENMLAYASLAKEHGASFIQILEPKAVGHYAGAEVTLKKDQLIILEQFFEKMNYDRSYDSYPLVAYHGYYSRRVGCAGSGKDYLYVDTDGDVHNCPFCQRKLFSALDPDLEDHICQMRANGCGVYASSSIIKNQP